MKESTATNSKALPSLWPSDLFSGIAGSDVEAAQLLVIVVLIVEVLQSVELLMLTELGHGQKTSQKVSSRAQKAPTLSSPSQHLPVDTNSGP